jgi:hypothetical protein
MLIITNPVEHTKQYLPSMLIKNQVQDNSQMRLVILNRNPSKLMQSNATVINKVIRTKIKDTLAFNQRVVAQNTSSSYSSKALEPRSFYSHQSSSTSIQSKQTSITKNNTPIKRKYLKERTKDRS